MGGNFRVPEAYQQYIASRKVVIDAVNSFVTGLLDKTTISQLLTQLELFEKEQLYSLYKDCAYFVFRERVKDGLVRHVKNGGEAVYFRIPQDEEQPLPVDCDDSGVRDRYKEGLPFLKKALIQYLMLLPNDGSFTLQSITDALALPQGEEKAVMFLYKRYVSGCLFFLERRGYLGSYQLRRPKIYYKASASTDIPFLSHNCKR